MDKWEYCIEVAEASTGLLSGQRLAELGQDGWELAAVHTFLYQQNGEWRATHTAWIFKRKKAKPLTTNGGMAVLAGPSDEVKEWAT